MQCRVCFLSESRLHLSLFGGYVGSVSWLLDVDWCLESQILALDVSS